MIMRLQALGVLAAASAAAAAAAGASGASPPAAVELAGIVSGPDFAGEVYERKHRYYPKAIGDATMERLRGIERRVWDKMNQHNRGLFKVIDSGKPVPYSGDLGGAGLARASETASIIVNSMQDGDGSIAPLSEAIENSEVIGISPNINMYTSPENRQGLSAHHDPQDVFILQVSGVKYWLVCEPLGKGRDLPTRVSDNEQHPLYYRYTAAQLQDTVCDTFKLEPSDVLYMPRGTIHAPYTLNNNSVHLTIGVDGDFTWGDFFKGLQRSGGVERYAPSAMAYFQCVPARDLNRLVPHFPLRGIKPDDIPENLVATYLNEFQSLDFSQCVDRMKDIVRCESCVSSTLSLMRQLQEMKAARQRKNRKLWDSS